MNLYLDIDGVILGTNAAGETALIPEFKNIVSYVRRHFICHWLTTHGRYGLKAVLDYLAPYLKDIHENDINFIQPVGWNTLKTEAIDFSTPFIWVDDEPLQFELELLEKRGVLASWLEVNSYRDISSLTVVLIEAKRQTILKNSMRKHRF